MIDNVVGIECCLLLMKVAKKVLAITSPISSDPLARMSASPTWPVLRMHILFTMGGLRMPWCLWDSSG